MVGTFFAVIIAVFLYLFDGETAANADFLGLTLLGVGSLVLLLSVLILALAWTPLQKAEKTMTPRLIEMFQRDHSLHFSHSIVFFFFLLSFAMAIEITTLHLFPANLVLIAWVIFLGITIDSLYRAMKRIIGYLNPLHVIHVFSDGAERSIRAAKEQDLCDWIDTLAETAIKAISSNSTSLALLAIDKLRLIARNYLHMAKGITYHEGQERKQQEPGMGEHVSYTLFFLFQRLEMIFNKALQEKLEPVCSALITTLGKISIYGAEFDVSMISYPLYYLGKLANKAQRDRLAEVADHATLTMLESSKAIVADVDLRYMEIEEPFLSMIGHMHEIAKETFRQEKSVSIQVIAQPFHELNKLFKSEKMASHQDTPAILKRINSVLEEFATLQTVLQTLPPISDLMKEESLRENKKETPEPPPPV
ncbi:MAG: hypothetical protein WB791_00515 [Waddliaceae bacterium]